MSTGDGRVHSVSEGAVYDMGGVRERFGPIPVEADEPVFHHPWEARVCTDCGEGLNVGRDSAAPGGTIKQVIVDVTGEPYRDLEKDALAMMSRD